MPIYSSRLIPGLQSVHLEGNRDSQKELSDYKYYVLYITRNLKGTNRQVIWSFHDATRQIGLLELDEEPISATDLIRAVELHGTKKNEALIYHYLLTLMEYYGHQQLRAPDFLSNVRHCILPNSNLKMVDLKGMFSLEVLDLSGNQLRKIEGLDQLTRYFI